MYFIDLDCLDSLDSLDSIDHLESLEMVVSEIRVEDDCNLDDIFAFRDDNDNLFMVDVNNFDSNISLNFSGNSNNFESSNSSDSSNMEYKKNNNETEDFYNILINSWRRILQKI